MIASPNSKTCGFRLRFDSLRLVIISCRCSNGHFVKSQRIQRNIKAGCVS